MTDLAAQILKLNATQRSALRQEFGGMIADLKVTPYADGSAVVQLGYGAVGGKRLWGYAFVGPRGKLSDVQKHTTAADQVSGLFA
jgi:hypothetical protein